jgi:hypothetical protein
MEGTMEDVLILLAGIAFFLAAFIIYGYLSAQADLSALRGVIRAFSSPLDLPDSDLPGSQTRRSGDGREQDQEASSSSSHKR